MLSNKQSLVLTGFITAGIFVFGVLDVLDNFIVLTVLTLMFFVLILNLIAAQSNSNVKKEKTNSKS